MSMVAVSWRWGVARLFVLDQSAGYNATSVSFFFCIYFSFTILIFFPRFLDAAISLSASKLACHLLIFPKHQLDIGF